MSKFTVIAGPNGAGKSSYSKVLSGINAVIFDPDKEKEKISKKYPDISEDAVEAELTQVYKAVERKALKGNNDFTVETNLRSLFLAERSDAFKKQGYEINLIFMMLPDVVHSFDRVNLRVKQKGHFVDAESIRVNFDQCLKNIKKIIKYFDNVMVLDASSNEQLISSPRLIAIMNSLRPPGLFTGDVPDWAAEYIFELQNLYFSS